MYIYAKHMYLFEAADRKLLFFKSPIKIFSSLKYFKPNPPVTSSGLLIPFTSFVTSVSLVQLVQSLSVVQSTMTTMPSWFICGLKCKVRALRANHQSLNRNEMIKIADRDDMLKRILPVIKKSTCYLHLSTPANYFSSGSFKLINEIFLSFSFADSFFFLTPSPLAVVITKLKERSKLKEGENGGEGGGKLKR